MTDLLSLLTWLLTPGSGVAAYALIELVPQLSKLSPKTKRLVAFGLSALISIVAYLAMVGMEYRPTPENWRMWVEALVSVALASGAFSQLVHGMTKLK